MKRSFIHFCAVLALASPWALADDFEDALASVDSADVANTVGMADEKHFEYFDCWVEEATRIIPKERSRIGAVRDEAKVCGCYTIREKGGFGWRGDDEPKRILKVWDVPKPRLLTCPKGSNCTMEMYVQQCMDYVKEAGPMLSDFAPGGSMEGAIALQFADDSSATPFGEYLNQHKAKADSVNCFFNTHGRPDAPADADRRNPAIFSLSGLPKKLVPDAIGRFTDYSDVRCLDSGVLTGFSNNGYIENIRHVDANGLIHGEEVGYMNDPSYPKRQGPEWGKVLWTAVYKRGKRDGVAKFYRSNVYDHSPTPYYFRHLEVPYTQGFVNGTVRMYSDKNFLMAEIPYKRNAMHGRMTVFNPFKKKNLTLTFAANNLEGFVDFGDFGGVFHKGLPNGLVTFWTVKDSCYQWMPGQSVCYSQRMVKKQWGTYKMGVFQGKMECANGIKGDINLICPDLDSAMVAKQAQQALILKQKKEQAALAPVVESVVRSAPKQMDSAAIAPSQTAVSAATEIVATPAAPVPVEPATVDSSAKQEAEPSALEKAKQARMEAEKALQEAKLAEQEALKAEQQAKKAERAAKKAEEKRLAKEKKAKKPKSKAKTPKKKVATP